MADTTGRPARDTGGTQGAVSRAGVAAGGAGPSGTRGDQARSAAGGPAPADAEGVSRFVEAFASQLVEGGVPRMPARVFAALLACEDGVLTSAELSEQLKVSPAAVSGAVRYLASLTMISREREPGSRRERYRVHRDQWYAMMTNSEGLLRRWESTLREGLATVGTDSRAGRRLAETLAFFEFIHTEFSSVLERWRERRDELFGAE